MASSAFSDRRTSQPSGPEQHVQRDRGGLEYAGLLDGAVLVGHGGDAIATLLQVGAQQLARPEVGFDDQHQRPVVPRSPRRRPGR